MANKTSDKNLWARKHLDLLGTVSDSAIAVMLKIRTAYVREKRESLAIASCRLGTKAIHVLSPEDVALLGTMPDTAVSQQLGISIIRVSTERGKRGIAAHKAAIAGHLWTPEEDAMLGVRSDAYIAVHLGIQRESAALRRCQLGIPRQRGSGSVFGGHLKRTREEIWTSEVVAKLGQVSDSVLAALLKIHSSEAKAEREARGIPRCVPIHPYTRDWSAAELGLIGTMSDTDVAKMLGISRAPVAVRRNALGIARFKKEKCDRIWLPEEDAMLGVKTDPEVAVALRINRLQVAARRNELGIPGQNGRKYPVRKN